ncbi:MAG: metallophosphoesterase [Planctomycetota bacterium]
MKVLVLSDLHMGSKASRAAAHVDDIARVAAGFDRVILNGDTLDRCYTTPITDERSLTFISDIQRTCASRNGPPELLTGNHDPVISKTHWTYDDESATLIFHGDCILDCTHPTKKSDQQLMAKLRERWNELGGRPVDFKTLHENYRAVQRLHMPSINPYKKPKTAFQYATSLIYPPRRPFDIIDYWMKAPGRALAVAKGFDKPVKHVVVGHTHRSGHWRIDGIDVYNTGSYMPFSNAFAICIEGGRVQHVKLDSLIATSRKVVAVENVS